MWGRNHTSADTVRNVSRHQVIAHVMNVATLERNRTPVTNVGRVSHIHPPSMYTTVSMYPSGVCLHISITRWSSSGKCEEVNTPVFNRQFMMKRHIYYPKWVSWYQTISFKCQMYPCPHILTWIRSVKYIMCVLQTEADAAEMHRPGEQSLCCRRAVTCRQQWAHLQEGSSQLRVCGRNKRTNGWTAWLAFTALLWVCVEQVCRWPKAVISRFTLSVWVSHMTPLPSLCSTSVRVSITQPGLCFTFWWIIPFSLFSSYLLSFLLSF